MMRIFIVNLQRISISDSCRWILYCNIFLACESRWIILVLFSWLQRQMNSFNSKWLQEAYSWHGLRKYRENMPIKDLQLYFTSHSIYAAKAFTGERMVNMERERERETDEASTTKQMQFWGFFEGLLEMSALTGSSSSRMSCIFSSFLISPMRH